MKPKKFSIPRRISRISLALACFFAAVSLLPLLLPIVFSKDIKLQTTIPISHKADTSAANAVKVHNKKFGFDLIMHTNFDDLLRFGGPGYYISTVDEITFHQSQASAVTGSAVNPSSDITRRSTYRTLFYFFGRIEFNGYSEVFSVNGVAAFLTTHEFFISSSVFFAIAIIFSLPHVVFMFFKRTKKRIRGFEVLPPTEKPNPGRPPPVSTHTTQQS